MVIARDCRIIKLQVLLTIYDTNININTVFIASVLFSLLHPKFYSRLEWCDSHTVIDRLDFRNSTVPPQVSNIRFPLSPQGQRTLAEFSRA